ncbi:hypothetical protein GCM10009678_50020 [Actinomadura kijaniata]|uniref:Uncharacterized protein n=1 Tax=Actinomadura namibiensis TaxID=182080 RepID=A0A7W3QLG5_ACTNM|nr:hypothetical protein [Actinomadura namibiensis]MBA8951524.1 hypothetical protein [Actinomadura namibiensis]
MSDQGERGVRWTEMSENDAFDRERADAPGAVRGDAGNGGEPVPHDVWGKVERPDARRPAPAPADEPEPANGTRREAPAEEPSAEPAPADPTLTQPVTTEPVTTEPAPTGPVTAEPALTEPFTAEPVATGPAPAEAPYAETGPQPAVPEEPYAATAEEPYAGADAGTGPQAAVPTVPAEAVEPYVRIEAPADAVREDTGPRRGVSWEDEERPAPRPVAPSAPQAVADAGPQPVVGDEPAPALAPDDIKVAPVPPGPRGEERAPAEPKPEQGPGWEGSLFDGDGEGDPRYAAVTPTGAGVPAKPGKPSSGNWQMPDWMADETAADAKLGGASGLPGEDGRGRSRLVLFGGVGLLVVALAVAGGVYYMKNSGGGEPAPRVEDKGRPAANAARKPQLPAPQLPPDRPLRKFPGKAGKVTGRVVDSRSGLVYPLLGKPWQVPTKKNKLGVAGWSGQQILVTERRGGRLWYGQLLTGQLPPTLQPAWKGPESLKAVTALTAQSLETNYYAFPHRTQPLASQALTVGGRKGWLIASRLAYQRAGVRATGEVVLTAVIDTGRPAPAVVFASLPNTHARMLPDLTQFVTRLKPAS